MVLVDAKRVLAAVSVALPAACGGAPRVAGTPQPTTNEEAFGNLAAVNCSAVRPKTEPDLMAWDPGSRMNLNMLRKRGIVVVRYVADGCNVELELIPNCLGEGIYQYEPYVSNDSKVLANKQELFSELPLGAARLAGKLEGNRALRTDYMLVGMATLPPTIVVKADDLKGPGCARATHVISRVYLGGFGMASGEERSLSAEATVFGAGVGASQQGTASRLANEGNPEQCKAAQQTGEEKPLCAVPLRIGLAPVEGAGQSACPAGSSWDGTRCVRQVEAVNCPPGTSWNGTQCVGAVSTSCPSGTHFVSGQGCVANVVSQPRAPAPSPAAAPAPTAASGRGPRMVRIPAGTFQMGSNDGESDEKPVHRVQVSAFEMDVTEVTVAQYRACVNAGSCQAPTDVGSTCNYRKSDRDQHPMNCVDWNEAQAFCSWAGKRLPTEEEWEYAARGSDGRKYPWGNDAPSPRLLNMRIRGNDRWAATAPVGSFSKGKSPFGLLDMAGNVWEWTFTRYCNSYSSSARCTSARVDRGGSWGSDSPSGVRAADRNRNDPAYRDGDLGFRCAR